MNKKNIGGHIRAARLAKGYTQEKLAELLDVSFQAVSSWECGLYLPDTEKLIELSRTLEVSIDLLLNDKPLVGKNWVLQDRMFDEKNMRKKVFDTAQALGLTDTLRALEFALEKHKFATRKGKDRVPYIYHPLLMACQAIAMGVREDAVLATCLLHDVVEDCGVRVEDLPVENGEIKEAVAALTHLKTQNFEEYIRVVSGNRLASIVKILDRCSNISTMATAFSEEKIAEYIGETEKYIVPLIDKTRKAYPEFYNACFIVKYQMFSVISTIKHVIK